MSTMLIMCFIATMLTVFSGCLRSTTGIYS